MATGILVDCATGEQTTVAVAARPLSEIKAARWEIAKARRDAAIDAGCAIPGLGTFDSDLISRTNIMGAVTGAILAVQAGQPFSVPWKLADNSVTTLDASQMIAVGNAVLAYVSACHAHAQAIGSAIQSAATPEALDAVNVEAGWP